jgi:hypothetical protein
MAHAENAIQQAELWLRANAPGALEAFEDALAQVAFVEHACTHVLGRRFENRPGTTCNRFPRCPPFRGNIPAYFASWPTVDERAILGQLRQKLTEALSHAGRDAAPVRHADAPGAPEAKPADPEAHAIALLFKHPHLTIPEIAAQVGVTRQTLYDWPKFRQAAEKADKLKPRGPKGQGPRRGHKTKDRRIEAYTKDSDPSAE